MKRCIRTICLLLAVICTVHLPFHVAADIIYYPQDPFFEAHFEECSRIERQFTVNGPNGKITVYESPESDKRIGTLTNGMTLYISYAYESEDGISWAFYEDWTTGISGWFPMDYLNLVYDIISFMEDHGHEVTEETGSFADVYAYSEARFHEYPGSPVFTESEVSQWNSGNGAETYSKVYVDANGDTWVMVDKLHYRMPEFWVNVSQDPDDFAPPETIPETLAAVTVEPSIDEIKPQEKPMGSVVWWILALVAMTGAALLLLKRKR